MTLDQVLPDFFAGKLIRRRGWKEIVTLHYEPPCGGQAAWAYNSETGINWSPSNEDFCADDWEIARENNRVIPRDEFNQPGRGCHADED